ncbi:MAG: hypothetical protein ACK4N5_10820, partial [Myxococcales bacterium]
MAQRHLARFFAAALTLGVFGCAGSGGATAGCAGGCMEPIPGGYKGTKTKDAVVARISPQGFDYLNSNWSTLVTTVMTTSKKVRVNNRDETWIPFEMPCTMVPDPGGGVGDVALCDNGQNGPGTTGFMDGKCDANDKPCPLLIRVQDVKLSPQSPNKLKADINLSINALQLRADVAGDLTNNAFTCQQSASPLSKNCNIFMAGPSNSSLCVWTKRLGCYANFYSSRQGRANEVLSATVDFGLDTRWDELLTFDIPAGISGIDKIEADDIQFGGTDRTRPGGGTEDMCDYACSIAGVGFVKDQIVRFAKPMIDREVKKAIAKQRCRACDAPGSSCPGTSRCDATMKICTTASSSASEETKMAQCVPLLLGMEGRMDPATVLGDFGVSNGSKVDIFAAAGGSLQVANDFQVGLLGGAKAV